MMGTGEASGDRRAIEAAEAAINNPLLEDASMQGAKGLLINITGGMDMTLFEVDEACNRVRDEVDPDANIIFGSTFNPELDGKIRVSVVATGIESALRMRQPTTHTGFSTEVAQTPAAKSGFGPSGQFGRGVTLRSGQGSNQMAAAPINTTGASVQQQATPAQQFSAQPQQPRTITSSQQQQNNYAAQINPAARATAAMQNATSPAGQSSAPIYGYGRTGNAALKVQEEFVAQPMTIGSLEHDTAEAFGAVAEDMNAYQPQSHRGERDGDSFIPPMPMMTQAKTVSATGTASAYAAPQRQPQQTNYSAAQEFASSVEHYVAAPIAQQAAPVQAPAPAPVVEPKRASLFDRLTGNTGSAASKQQAAPVQQPVQQPASSAVIKTQTPSQQPALAVDNSDRIPATSSFDDDLDIPAFLRRQSS
jgi:cell division protein FtsZ